MNYLISTVPLSLVISCKHFVRLVGLTEKDEEKRKLAAVKNELESFSYDVKNKLYEEEYEAVSTEEEREEIREKLSAIIDWYEEQPLDTPLSVSVTTPLSVSLATPLSVSVASTRRSKYNTPASRSTIHQLVGVSVLIIAPGISRYT